jgi:hypothetical protein
MIQVRRGFSTGSDCPDTLAIKCKDCHMCFLSLIEIDQLEHEETLNT